MRRELFYWLNYVFLVAITFLICNIQTVILKLPVFSWMGVDLVLLVITYIGLKRPTLGGLVLTFTISHLTEIHSGSPVGIITSCYLVTLGATILTREFFIMESPFSTVMIGLFSGIVWKIAFLILSYKMGILDNVWRSSLLFLLPFLISQGLLIRPVFGLLQRLDAWTKFGEQSEFQGSY